jgi:hypothetical protein
MKESKMKKAFLVSMLLVLVATDAIALDANPVPNSPVGDGLMGGLISLWGPFLGVIAAIVVFFNALARVIPNSTTNGILQVLLKISSVLGLKIEDKK